VIHFDDTAPRSGEIRRAREAGEQESGNCREQKEPVHGPQYKLRTMRPLLRLVLCVAVGLAAFGLTASEPLSPGLYAVFDTSMGTITVKLFEDKAPVTVKNFVALARGTKPTANKAGRLVRKPLYNGLTFHRVIKGFMIQTGDIRGTGDSVCGVPTIPDEIDPELKFDQPGRLAMANIGKPNTANCQVFITVGPADHLDGHFTIFGQVVSGQDVADKIADVPVGEKDRPLEPVILKTVTIRRQQ
jgi:cyclophilin family peptidyl-prolyl cis-trans isomerase